MSDNIKGLLKKLGKKILIILAPWLLLFLVILFVVGNMLELFQSLTNAINGAVAWAKETGAGAMSGLEDFWTDLENGEVDLSYPKDYETIPMDSWNGKSGTPTDPNMTAIIYQTMKKHKKRKDEGTAVADSEKAIADAWDQFNSDDHTMLSSDDVRKFLKHARNKSDHMFEMTDCWYQYKSWGLEPLTNEDGSRVEPYQSRWYVEPKTICTSEVPYVGAEDTDAIYRNLSRVKIEGEASAVDGEDREFAPIWQDYIALAGLVAFDKGRNKNDKINDGSKWGHGIQQGSSPTNYDNGKKDDATDTDAAKISTTDGSKTVENYFLTGREREKVWNVFDYQFSYKNGWDGVKKAKSHSTKASAYTYNMDEDKLNASEKIGYRFKYVHCPWSVGDVIYDAQAPEEMPYTKYVPESAPSSIKSGWQYYEYVYVPTEYVPADMGGWEGRSEPPDGVYCLGRWHYENPALFIMAMAEMTGYREKLSGDEYWSTHHVTHTKMGNGDDMHEGDDEDVTYDWETEMMEQFGLYLDMLEIDNGSGSGLAGRRDYYKALLDAYKNRKLTITYEGTGGVDAYNDAEMRADFEKLKDECLENIYKVYVEHYKRIGKPQAEAEELAEAEKEKWKAANEDLEMPEGGDYIKVEDNLTNIPFYSYGVIYGNPSAGSGGNGGDDNGEYFEDNSDMTRTGSFWISSHPAGQEGPHRQFNYYEGSCADLRMASPRYTEEQLAKVLEYIDGRSSGAVGVTFNTSESAHALYQYGVEHKVDVVGILAIIVVEGGHKTTRAREAWNFFNIKAGSGEPRYNGSEWKDFTKTSSSAGEALSQQVGWITDRYIYNGQYCYLLMQFNKYAMWPGGTTISGPQNDGEADQADAQCFPGNGGHCFCPWWDDPAYLAAYVDTKAWCNQNASMYNKMRNYAGIRSNSSDDGSHGSIDPKWQDPANSTELRARIMQIAAGCIGKDYEWGAEGPDTFDCSGFTKYCYKTAGYSPELPHGADYQYHIGTPISVDQLKVGDLIFFEGTQKDLGPGKASHVGIYCGDGNMIHCGDPCKVSNLHSYTMSVKLLGCRNIIGD